MSTNFPPPHLARRRFRPFLFSLSSLAVTCAAPLLTISSILHPVSASAAGSGNQMTLEEISRKLSDLDKENQQLRRTNTDLVKRVNALEKQRASAPTTNTSTEKKSDSTPAKGQDASASANSAGHSAKDVLNADLKTLKDTDITVQQISDGFSVPQSPAAAALGLSQDKVQHFDTPKQLISSTINGLDEHGHFQSGLSVDWAPAQYIWGNRSVADFRYQRNDSFAQSLPIWFERVLLRTQISLASTKGASDADKSSKFALGIHTVLASASDPLSNANAKKIDAPNSGTDRTPAVAGKGDFIVLAKDNRRLDAPGRELNFWTIGMGDAPEEDLYFCGQGPLCKIGNFIYTHVSLSAGAAPEWVAQDDNSHYEYAGTTVWGSLAYVPSRNFAARFICNAIYHQGELIAGSDALSGSPTGDIKQDSLFVVGGVQFGNRDFNATATAAYLHLDQGSFGKDSAFRYGIAAEKRVGNSNTWLTFSLSKDEGHTDGKNQILALGGVKIGLGGRDFVGADQTTRHAQASND